MHGLEDDEALAEPGQAQARSSPTLSSPSGAGIAPHADEAQAVSTEAAETNFTWWKENKGANELADRAYRATEALDLCTVFPGPLVTLCDEIAEQNKVPPPPRSPRARHLNLSTTSTPFPLVLTPTFAAVQCPAKAVAAALMPVLGMACGADVRASCWVSKQP